MALSVKNCATLCGYACAAALFELAKKIPATAAIDCAPAEPPSNVFLGEKYVNNQTLSDVTFLVEGKEFYAHRIALLASSDIFRQVLVPCLVNCGTGLSQLFITNS